MSGGGEHGVNRLRAQTARARVAQHLGLRGFGVESGPVRASLAHRLVAVGSREDARRPAERRCERLAVVATAVETFVVGARQLADRSEWGRMGERALGEVRVPLAL